MWTEYKNGNMITDTVIANLMMKNINSIALTGKPSFPEQPVLLQITHS